MSTQKIDYTKYKSEQFIKELPDLVNNLDAMRKGGANGLPSDISLGEMTESKYGISYSDYIQKLGINPSKDSLNLLFTMPDKSVRWVVPEIIRTAITLGLRQAPFYPNIIVSDQPVSQLKVTMPYINMSDAAPSRINEAETIPLGTISYNSKEVGIFKIGKGIKVTDEVTNYVSLDVVAIFFRDFGIQLGYSMDNLAIDTILNGDTPDGSESAPVIGVTNPANGLVYRDLIRVWVRAARMGRNLTTIIGGEEQAIDTLDLPEFKQRQSGTTEATLVVHTPIPNRADFYIHGGLPENQLALIDPSMAMLKLTAQPLMLESERIVSNQTEATYATLTTGFAKMFQDASIIIDSSLDFASNGFPAYMDIDPLLNVQIER